MNEPEYEKLINELRSVATAQKSDIPRFDPSEYKDRMRAGLARLFIYAYFVALAVAFGGAMGYNIALLRWFCLNGSCALLDVKEMILLVSGLVGPSLGFVIAYYFKDKEL